MAKLNTTFVIIILIISAFSVGYCIKRDFYETADIKNISKYNTVIDSLNDEIHRRDSIINAYEKNLIKETEQAKNESYSDAVNRFNKLTGK